MVGARAGRGCPGLFSPLSMPPGGLNGVQRRVAECWAVLQHPWLTVALPILPSGRLAAVNRSCEAGPAPALEAVSSMHAASSQQPASSSALSASSAATVLLSAGRLRTLRKIWWTLHSWEPGTC